MQNDNSSMPANKLLNAGGNPVLPQKMRDITDEKLLALYLLHQAALEKANYIVLRNSFLQEWLGVSRVHSQRAHKFSRKLQPIFPVHSVEDDGTGHTIIKLALATDIPIKDRRTKYISEVPPLEEIEKGLGFQSVHITVTRI